MRTVPLPMQYLVHTTRPRSRSPPRPWADRFRFSVFAALRLPPVPGPGLTLPSVSHMVSAQ